MEHLSYNLKIKTFADGSQRFYKSGKVFHRMGDEERLQKALFDEHEASMWFEYGGSLHSLRKLDDYLQEIEHKKGHTIERKEKENMKRAVQIVYDIARSNVFDYFVTFTFDPDKIDSFSYDACCAALAQWLDVMRKRGCLWLIVPEQHKSGRWHFHGLLQGKLDLYLAVNPHTNEVLFDDSGNPIYNCGNFDWGYTTATEIRDPQRTASYLAKYISKTLHVPKGKKRYWASRKLKRPEESFLMISDPDFGDFVDADKCRFFKDVSNSFGRFMIAEIDV